MSPEARARLERFLRAGPATSIDDDLREALATIDAQAARVRELEEALESVVERFSTTHSEVEASHVSIFDMAEIARRALTPLPDAKTGSAG